MRLAFASLSLALALLLASQAAAPVLAEEESAASPVEIDLETFLRTAAQTAGVTLVWDPQDKAIRGKTMTSLAGLSGIPRSEVLSTVRSLLTFFDLVIVPTGPRDRRFYVVMDARQTQSILNMKPTFVDLTDENVATYEGQDGLFITALIAAPRVTDPAAARSALQRIVTGQNIGSLQEIPPDHFVVTDFAPNVATIYRTLRALESQAAARPLDGVKTVRLAHASAAELGMLLAAQFASVPQPAVAQQAGRAAPPPSSPVRVQGDRRTNTLIVSGPADVVAQVLEVVQALDVPGEPEAVAPVRTAPQVDPTVRRLESVKVSLDVEEQSLEEVLRTLQAATQVQIVVTPSARSRAFRDATITLHALDITPARVLELVCPVGDCEWKVEQGIVYVTDQQGR